MRRGLIVASFLTAASIASFAGALYQSYRQTTEYERDPCRTLAETGAMPANGVYPDGTQEGRYPRFGMPICVVAPSLASAESNPLLLFLNGQQFADLTGRIVDRSKGLVEFTLNRTAVNREAWDRVIGYPPGDGHLDFNVGMGTTKGEFDHGSTPAILKFRLFDEIAMWLGVFAMLCALVALVVIGATTRLVKDGTDCFSLARCQMAFWLYLITVSFIYIWLVTGVYNDILTPESLVLLGISSTTALAAVTIDGVSTAGQGAAQGNQAAQSLGRKFLRDILYDGDSPAVHRMQMIIWTLLLGLVFVWQVYYSFRFPKFDPNLLILMGVSGGFYLGFKTKET